MKVAIALLMLFAPASFLVGQTKNPVSSVLRDALPGRQKNTIAAFETMPAEKYDYKPTPDQMTFGHLAAHIVEGNYFFCSNVGDVPRPKMDELQGTEGKDKLIAAVKASFDFCGTALERADDSKLGDSIQWFDNKPRPRAAAFLALASSWADHYGQAAMYLRLNGLLPPTAQKPKPEEKKPEENKK